MDRTALITGLFGVAIGAGALYHVMKRNWWGLTGFLSIGAAVMLSLVTDGLRPPDERIAVSAVEAALIVSFTAACTVQLRHVRRRGAATRRL
jgi:hypothetical protein